MLEAVPVQPALPGWWYLFPEHHPAAPTPPPASSSQLAPALAAQVNPMSPEPLVWASLWLLGYTSAPTELMHFPGKTCLLLQVIILCNLCHGKCSLWEFPGQCPNCAVGFGPS